MHVVLTWQCMWVSHARCADLADTLPAGRDQPCYIPEIAPRVQYHNVCSLQ